jgi:HEPN domain-containing protein
MSARDEELARAWFGKPERDLLTADIMLGIAPPPTDIVCFHCHQVAEKYLKGFLAWNGIPLIKTHDLADLLAQCCVVDPRLASLHSLAVLLTDYAVDVRYPGLPHSEPGSEETSVARDAASEIRFAVLTALGVPP